MPPLLSGQISNAQSKILLNCALQERSPLLEGHFVVLDRVECNRRGTAVEETGVINMIQIYCI
jgi:hypothetical protein